MKILIFGGTTEGRVLAEKLTESGYAVTVSVATKLGAEQLEGIACEISEGRLEQAEMTELVSLYDLVIDATHPYAVFVSKNIRGACKTAGIPLHRLLRPPSDRKGCFCFENHQDAAQALGAVGGNVLLTIGSKELANYRALDPDRMFVRVLPTHEALNICEDLRIPHGHILAMQGPFSEELNAAVFRQYEISCLVTKDGGTAGGFPEKINAARKAGVAVYLIGRPEDTGMTMEEILEGLEGTP